MARTLQALGRNGHGASMVSLLANSVPAGAAMAAPVEEIPFIEVGGKNPPFEASASVLACVPAQLDLLHAKRVPPRPPTTPPVEPALDAGPPHSIEFHPLPKVTAPLPPARERLAQELMAFHDPEHPISKQYLAVADAMEQQFATARSPILLFTTPSIRSTPTAVLLNLAIARSRKGHARQVLVDVDGAGTGVAAALGLPVGPGLAEVMCGSCSLTRALRPTGVEGLETLLAGHTPDPSLTLGGEALSSILRHLKASYERVLVHAPAWDGRPDVSALGALCDAVYVVLNRDEVNQDSTRRLLDLIPMQGSRLRGYIVA